MPIGIYGIRNKIADRYRIARTAITKIANGTRWANVTGGSISKVRK